MRKRAAISLGIIALLLMAALVILSHIYERCSRASCYSSLRALGMCLKQYAADNSNEFPYKDGAAGWELLRCNNYCCDYKIYTCPSSATVPEKKGPLYESSVSFVYLGGFLNSEKSMIPIAFDKLSNHSSYVNVFFASGKVDAFKGSFRSNSDVITMLNEKYKYSPEDLKRLQEKAAKLDQYLDIKKKTQ